MSSRRKNEGSQQNARFYLHTHIPVELYHKILLVECAIWPDHMLPGRSHGMDIVRLMVREVVRAIEGAPDLAELAAEFRSAPTPPAAAPNTVRLTLRTGSRPLLRVLSKAAGEEARAAMGRKILYLAAALAGRIFDRMVTVSEQMAGLRGVGLTPLVTARVLAAAQTATPTSAATTPPPQDEPPLDTLEPVPPEEAYPAFAVEEPAPAGLETGARVPSTTKGGGRRTRKKKRKQDDESSLFERRDPAPPGPEATPAAGEPDPDFIAALARGLDWEQQEEGADEEEEWR